MNSKQEGFLSKNLGATIAKIRRDFASWFDLLEACNRLAMDVLPHVKPATTDKQQLLEAAFYGKAVQSIQAVVILAERGMSGDARVLLRSGVETAIVQRKVDRVPARGV